MRVRSSGRISFTRSIAGSISRSRKRARRASNQVALLFASRSRSSSSASRSKPAKRRGTVDAMSFLLWVLGSMGRGRANGDGGCAGVRRGVRWGRREASLSADAGAVRQRGQPANPPPGRDDAGGQPAAEWGATAMATDSSHRASSWGAGEARTVRAHRAGDGLVRCPPATKSPQAGFRLVGLGNGVGLSGGGSRERGRTAGVLPLRESPTRGAPRRGRRCCRRPGSARSGSLPRWRSWSGGWS